MILTYSGQSRPSALAIHNIANGKIIAKRQNYGDINWGRATALTRLNRDTSNVTNKRIMRTLFHINGVPMPKLLDMWSVEYPCIGRPDRHSKGRGLWKCNNWTDVMNAVKGTRRKKGATHFMEYVTAPHEYRVHIFNGKSIRMTEKLYGTTGETAHGLYTTIKPTGVVNHVRDAAKKAVEAVGLDFGTVDILANDNKCWVLEVNTAPGLGGSMPRVWAETFNKWERGLI